MTRSFWRAAGLQTLTTLNSSCPSACLMPSHCRPRGSAGCIVTAQTMLVKGGPNVCFGSKADSCSAVQQHMSALGQQRTLHLRMGGLIGSDRHQWNKQHKI